MTDFALTHLAPAASRLGWIAARPRMVAAGCVVVFTTVGFVVLAAAETSGALMALCGPLTATPNFVMSFALWCAMSLAMMLPTAAPMILTYAEIAEAAARKGDEIISPLVLTAGYATVWLAFAAVAAGAQTMTAGVALEPRVATLVSALLFVGAGVYQFTALKHACLNRCRQPFQFFFTNWSTTTRGVFRLGLRQGGYCLGCCWALMALMFAVGSMNVIWMAALGAVMTIEKMSRSKVFPRAIGVALIGIGCGLAIR